MAYIQKRETKDGKASYRVQVRLRGFPIQTATFGRKTDARKWAQKIETEMRDGRHFGTSHAKRDTVVDLIDRYIADILPRNADGTKRAQLLWWREALGENVAVTLTVDVIAAARDKLLKRPNGMGGRISPSSANRYVAALSSVFTTAMKEWRVVPANPVRDLPKLKEPPGRVRYLDKSELERLLKACRISENKYIYPIVVLALSVGSRKSNIASLTWKNVDLVRHLLFFERTKNDQPHRVPLCGLALELVAGLHENREEDCPYLFPNPKRTNPVDFRTAWRTAIRRAKIKDFRFHDLRHSCASFLAANGVGLHEIADILGHKSMDMTRRYAHLTDSHVAATVEQMNEKVFGEQ